MEKVDIPKLVDSVLGSLLDIEIIPSNLSVQNCEKWDSLVQLSLVSWLESDFNLSLDSNELVLITSRNGLILFLERLTSNA